jgi:hypothetical protein
VIQIGELPLPPNRDRVPLASTANLIQETLQIFLGGSVAVTARSDVLFTLPIDSWLELSTSSGGLASSSSRIIFSNDLDAKLYIEDTATGVLALDGAEIMKGSGITLMPGVNNRVHFLASGSTGLYVKNTYLTVEMWYKPRRETL